MTTEKLRRKLFDSLPEERVRHTNGVVAVAVSLARALRVDTEKVEIAALLHDCAKFLAIEGQIRYAQENGIYLSEADLQSKGVIHSRVGAHMALTVYKVSDPEILDAIRNHTTGNAGLGIIGRIVFAADILDPNRGLPENAKLTRKAHKNFERTVLKLIKSNMKYVLKLGLPLHPDSVAFYNDQLHRVKKPVLI